MKIIFFLGLFVGLSVLVNPVLAADHYVRSGASGESNGADWTNAWAELPAVLVRGDTYFIADGSYAGYTFDDVESGEDVITVKKATVATHGTDTGWSDDYGDGAASFSADVPILGASAALVINRGYYTIDGTVGGGPGNWQNGYGIEISDTNDNRVLISVGDTTNPVTGLTLAHLKLSGGYEYADCNVADYETRAIRASNASVKTDFTIRYCSFSDFAGPAVNVQNFSNLVFEYNLNDRWHSGPYCHGSGIRMDYFHHATIRYNNFRNGAGSNWVGAYNGPNHDLFVYGNIFACDAAKGNCSGSPALVSSEHTSGDPDIYNMFVYNNTFHDIIGIVPNMIGAEDEDDSDDDEVYAQNNIFYGCDITGTYVSATGTMRAYHSYNASDEIIADDAGFQQLFSSPFITQDPSNSNYLNPASATNAGAILGSPYDKDMFSQTRGEDGIWDRGALEFVDGQADTTAPGSPVNLSVH